MKAFKKILKKIREINIEAFQYVFIEGVGWEKNIDFNNLPNRLEKRFFWELENLDEEKLQKLQSDALNELSLLSYDQLKRCLNRIELINQFQIFFDFIKSFYVKFDNGEHSGLDIFDFKENLKRLFYTSLPDKGDFDINFLEELQDQLFFKSSILDGLKWQIECLLRYEEPLTPQHKEENIYDKIIKELDLIQQIYNSQIVFDIENITWSQMENGRYCNFLYINTDENLFEISKYKNYYTERIDKHNSALLRNEIQKIYDKALWIYDYFVKELKDHKDKKDYYVGEDGKKQIIESTVLFVVREFAISVAIYNCDVEEQLFKNFTKSGNTKKCKNETLLNFCVQLLEFIDLTGGLKQPQETEIRVSKVKDYKKENWFIIGLLFANGEMDKLLQKHNRNGTQIAKELGNERGFRPYITESIGVKKRTASKSVFSSKEKMNKIISYCESLNIPVIPDFTKALPLE